MPGHHAVLNALAALAVGLEFGMTFEDCREGLEHFGGILRRFELKGEAAGVTVIDDYGHHPTEIRATLAAARAAYPGRRLVALFQPHRYTRTADLFDEFVRCFDDADEVLVTDIYAAGESAGTGPDGAALAAAIAAGHRGTVGHLDSREQSLAGRVASRLGAGDLLVTLGAGDITRSGPEILALLEG
jgi:UDP-N-acetylmuramate--alanine ligase